ncbi:MAG: trigger factor [Candidatus Staskawiczbacteria bacterium RIFCSPLOWO2_01_FULL_38_12b]|uniref:Trigger factor n=1 Tax=Candidatus Staskawiczbacteria bacterium RIFCSPLOWO2_01_FULL_38_12b TaxID=1802214 RepID=A0A1G2ICB2_9BACT|nr:MAG: trigger factor [Candidatus Staskawiczbacteria bacterium RIFCSPLOWO2_01_FULL_38_12b]
MKTSIKKLDKSQIEIQFELTAQEFAKYFDQAVLHLKEHVKMDGFRKGHVPANMVEEKIGKENILMEAGDLAVKWAYSKFVEEQKLEPIGDPDVQIKKIAKGSEFLFTVKVTVLPEVTLPDYKEMVSRVKQHDVLVTEKEIQETIDYLQKSRAKFTLKNEPAIPGDFVEIEYATQSLNDGKAIKDRFILGNGGFLKDFEENVIGMQAGQEKEFTAKFPENTPRKDLAGKDATFNVKMLSVQKMELAQINDDFAKSLGTFDTLVALKENLKEGITLEKQETEKQRARSQMLEEISEKVNFDLPEKMVEFEKERLLEDLKVQVAGQFNIPFEQYLASVKKTEQEIKDTYRLEAEKRIKNFLVLRQIGKAENIEVTPEELAQDLPKLMKNYTQEQLKKIDIGQLTEYSKGAIFNEKVFQKLENFSNHK